MSSASPRSGRSCRGLAPVLIALGVVLLVLGWFVDDDYWRGLCLELGGATVLVAPFARVERKLLQVEDGVAQAVNAGQAPPGPIREQVAAALAGGPFTVVAVEGGNPDHVVERGGAAVAVVVLDGGCAVDAASLQRLDLERRGRPGATGLVVVTASGPTGLAREWAARHASTTRVVRWTPDGAARADLVAGVAELLPA
ncbi:hypothetical protein [Actinosynnema pretiosum]|uniref:hypothetical protein n=1 Tax=Actinosynnema pretiosum TaxID=42197 RepID=UPI0012FD00FE|nr:hypothetical protein [Actinosynnema pretiosum]